MDKQYITIVVGISKKQESRDAIGFIVFSVGLNCEVPTSNETVPEDVQPKLGLGPSRILAAAAT